MTGSGAVIDGRTDIPACTAIESVVMLGSMNSLSVAVLGLTDKYAARAEGATVADLHELVRGDSSDESGATSAFTAAPIGRIST